MLPKKRRPIGHVSLERALSKLGVASRTEARALILKGQVSVNSRIVQDPEHWVSPEKAKIQIEGEKVLKAEPIVLLLNKPRGVVTTRKDEKGRPTVYDCLKEVTEHLIPVGRLDFATSGLLLMTNDTRFSAWITDPANEIPRTYLVSVKGEVTEEDIRAFERGIEDEGEILRASQVRIRKSSQKESHLVVTLTEGKNREIRRLFKARGNEVTQLKRVQFGGLELGDLPLGNWRKLTFQEVSQAFPGAPLQAPPSEQQPIYMVIRTADWKAAQLKGCYESLSLSTEGFIHCSLKNQVPGVLERYFKNQENLLLLKIDPARVEAEIKFEGKTSEKFPHIYGPLNLNAVLDVTSIQKGTV